MNLKPFDLEAAKRGETVVAGYGSKVRIVFFDMKNPRYPIVAIQSGDDGIETEESFSLKGKYVFGEENDDQDLFMASKTKTYYVNVFKDSYGNAITGRTYNSEEEAIDNKTTTHIKTISFEIEE